MTLVDEFLFYEESNYVVTLCLRTISFRYFIIPLYRFTPIDKRRRIDKQDLRYSVFSYDLIATVRYEGVTANAKNYGELVAIK